MHRPRRWHFALTPLLRWRWYRAWPGLTLLRGQVVWDGQSFTGRPGDGRFLARGLPSLFPIGARAPGRRSWLQAALES